MVIYLNLPASFHRALRYNERKVERGQALCIHAGNFILDANQLTPNDMFDRFVRLERLRPDHPRRAIHASLNFHPDDRPNKEKFIRVATDYVREIGFGAQPWLLYQHTDTQVPHVHLLSSRVTTEGKILEPYQGLAILTEGLRRLEKEHGLMHSLRRERNPALTLSTARAVRPIYGQSFTRDSIASGLAHVLPNYNYSNLTELNAILRQYGIWADNGKPGGDLAAIRGVSYQLLNSEGRPVGKRVGAGAIGFNPGLDYLEARFRENARLTPADLRPLATRVQLAGLRAADDWRQFSTGLRSAGIESIPFMSKQGQVYDIVFVDHNQKLAASAGRLADPASLNLLYTPLSKKIDHQYRLVQDMNRAHQQLLVQPPAEDTRTLHLRLEKQHKISR